MIALADLGIGVLIFSVAFLIFGVGIKLIKDASKNDQNKEQ